MMLEPLTFWILAIGLIVAAWSVILQRNPVASALSLAAGFVLLGILFLTLGSSFLMMAQIIVYAGAVMVLFLFIIMLLDLKTEEKRPVPYARLTVAVLIAAAFGCFLGTALTVVPRGGEVLSWAQPAPPMDAGRIGELLFAKYVLPFEVTGVLLLVATVGVIVLGKKEAK
ncbi:MAG: NADH-quinone oxidoreductase subunit J [Verrucomicrobiales bacterium]|jgi:NADH-quinone oxidoreductase subunit J|nr:NADH-quinone oxidoreductase subunit J [Verrucomicrobiales bacterium]